MLLPASHHCARESRPQWYYARRASEFLEDAHHPLHLRSLLQEAHTQRWEESPGRGELNSWEHSPVALARLLEYAGVTTDQLVILEYCLDTGGRIDAIICGTDRQDRLNAVLLELKQWEEDQLEHSTLPRSVSVRIGRNWEERLHPSIQVLRYRNQIAEILAPRERKGAEHLRLSPYAYLHNCTATISADIYTIRRVLLHHKFREYVHAAPLFTKNTRATLARKIARRVERGGGDYVLQRLVREPLKNA